MKQTQTDQRPACPTQLSNHVLLWLQKEGLSECTLPERQINVASTVCDYTMATRQTNQVTDRSDIWCFQKTSLMPNPTASKMNFQTYLFHDSALILQKKKSHFSTLQCCKVSGIKFGTIRRNGVQYDEVLLSPLAFFPFVRSGLWSEKVNKDRSVTVKVVICR